MQTQMQNQSRAYTEEEIRDQFLHHVAHLVQYWNSEVGSNVPEDESSRGRLEGLAFSMLSAIDGCSMSLPGFTLKPYPHPTDKQYHIDNDENYYPDDVDIAGGLHELIHSFLKGKPSS
jgi:hypothetical protein